MDKNNAHKQYSYGNLHIGECDDKFLVHDDKIDPRKDPMKHLACDAPESLIGLACVIFGSLQITKKVLNKNSKKLVIASSLISSIIPVYLRCLSTRKIKNY